MALYVIATPIGNSKDFTLRALEILKNADLIIGEELKVLRQILKAAGVQAKEMECLNEHSDAKDLAFLTDECKAKTVALVSDCGTPGFCDPGALLVKSCRDSKIDVHAVPGPSSLMALLSVCGERVDEFVFKGFLPAKMEERSKSWASLKKEGRPLILMETPYRLRKFLEDLGEHFPQRLCVLGLNLTQEGERVVRAQGKAMSSLVPESEGEPIVLII